MILEGAYSPLPGEGQGERLQKAHNPLRDSLDAVTVELELHPDSVELQLKRAHWNLELEQWEYAKTDYDDVLRRHPGNPAALFYRAFANERLGRNGFARSDYETLLKVIPEHFEARLLLALLNDKDNHRTEAMDQLNQLVEQFPDSALAYGARATVEADRGQHLLAEYDFTEALVRDPDNTDYLLGRANSAISLGHKEVARRDLDRLVALGLARNQLNEYYEKMRKL